jgi:hypothetical protein
MHEAITSRALSSFIDVFKLTHDFKDLSTDISKSAIATYWPLEIAVAS